MAECVIIQGQTTPKTVILYSITVESEQEEKLLDFFFPLKVVREGWVGVGGGGQILIFSIAQLLFTCIMTVIKIHICHLSSEGQMCFLYFIPSFLWGCHLHCKRRARLCLLRLDLKVGEKRNSSGQSCDWSCHTGTFWHRQLAHKASGINNMKFLPGQVKGSLVKRAFFSTNTKKIDG